MKNICVIKGISLVPAEFRDWQVHQTPKLWKEYGCPCPLSSNKTWSGKQREVELYITTTKKRAEERSEWSDTFTAPTEPAFKEAVFGIPQFYWAEHGSGLQCSGQINKNIKRSEERSILKQGWRKRQNWSGEQRQLCQLKTTEKRTVSAIRHGTSTSSKTRGQAKKQLDKYFAAFQKIQTGSTQRF